MRRGETRQAVLPPRRLQGTRWDSQPSSSSANRGSKPRRCDHDGEQFRVEGYGMSTTARQSERGDIAAWPAGSFGPCGNVGTDPVRQQRGTSASTGGARRRCATLGLGPARMCPCGGKRWLRTWPQTQRGWPQRRSAALHAGESCSVREGGVRR